MVGSGNPPSWYSYQECSTGQRRPWTIASRDLQSRDVYSPNCVVVACSTEDDRHGARRFTNAPLSSPKPPMGRSVTTYTPSSRNAEVHSKVATQTGTARALEVAWLEVVLRPDRPGQPTHSGHLPALVPKVPSLLSTIVHFILGLASAPASQNGKLSHSDSSR